MLYECNRPSTAGSGVRIRHRAGYMIAIGLEARPAIGRRFGEWGRHVAGMGGLLAAIALTGTPGSRADIPAQGVLREVYLDTVGTTLAALTNHFAYPDYPLLRTIEPAFDMPVDAGIHYGTRWRAWLVPSRTGRHRFWIASEGPSILYLGAGEDPASKVPIAQVDLSAEYQEWGSEAGQGSTSIDLAAGQRYYIEAIHVQDGLGGHLAVSWMPPFGSGPEPIPTDSLNPYGAAEPWIVAHPWDQTAFEGEAAIFSIGLFQPFAARYQWYRNGQPIPDETQPMLVWAQVRKEDDGSRFHCVAADWVGSIASRAAALEVLPDTVAPEVLGAMGGIDGRQVRVTFSEPVAVLPAALASNYAIEPSGHVQSARLAPDHRTVVLAVSLPESQDSTLVIRQLTDAVSPPNAAGQPVRIPIQSEPGSYPVRRPEDAREKSGPGSRRTPLAITEIMYWPAIRADGRNLEFIEIYNSQAWEEEIGGFRLAGSIDYTFPEGTRLGSKSYGIVAGSAADLEAVFGQTPIGEYTGSLPDDGGAIRLINRQGAVLLEIEYRAEPPWAPAAAGLGHSLVLARPSLGQNHPRAWSSSEAFGGSPGAAEAGRPSSFDGIRINEFRSGDGPGGGEPGFIELFNASGSSIDLSGLALSDEIAADRYVFPKGTTLAPGGFLVCWEAALGFGPGAPQAALLLKDPEGSRLVDAVGMSDVIPGAAYGRHPDGGPAIGRLAGITPGQANPRPERPAVVINEIMFHPSTGGADDEFIELHNRTAEGISLAGWRLQGAVDYAFPAGSRIEGGGWLVIGSNPDRLAQLYPWLRDGDVAGPWTGRLDNEGERIELVGPVSFARPEPGGTAHTITVESVMDAIAYSSTSRSSRWADGLGSSLELSDPRADAALSPHWMDSDESGKAGWITIEHTGILDHGLAPANAVDVLMLGPGECLVDDIEVIGPDGENRVVNGGFESGMAPWSFRGSHDGSGLAAGSGEGGGACLHVRASGRGDTGANQVHGLLTAPLAPGEIATLRMRVRWVAGSSEILLRLRGNWLEAVGRAHPGAGGGTPGRANSRRLANAPPAITDVRHDPPIPPPGAAVTVWARADDPDGLSSVMLVYRLDPGMRSYWVPMRSGGGGWYWAAIPGQSSGMTAAFHLVASDLHAISATARFPAEAPRSECLIRWGDPRDEGPFGGYHLWITQATLGRWRQREKQSHQPLDATFVSSEGRIAYNVGAHYAGSAVKANYHDSPMGNYCDYNLYFSADEPWLGETDVRITWPGNYGSDATLQQEITAYWAIGEMGLPACHRRHVAMWVNGVRRGMLLEDVQQPGGDLVEEWFPATPDGDLHEVQWWFEFGPQLVRYSPAGASLEDIRTLGGHKKLAWYRWTWPRRGSGGLASDYASLFALIDVVNFPTSSPAFLPALKTALDLDSWLRTLAIQHAVGNFDSFGYLEWTGHNLYIFKPTGGPWKCLIWDVDASFGEDPAANLFEFGDPALRRVLGIPSLRRQYLRWLAEAARGPLDPARHMPGIEKRYAAFRSAGLEPEYPSGITNYLHQRRQVIHASIDSARAPFALQFPVEDGIEVAGHTIALIGSGPLEMTDLTINGRRHPIAWTSITNWTASVELEPGVNQFVLAALGADGIAVAGLPSPLTVVRAGSLPDPGQVVINEIMTDLTGQGRGYVELHNRSEATAVDLNGWELAGAVIADEVAIEPGQFVLWVESRDLFEEIYGEGLPVGGELSRRLDPWSATLVLTRPGTWPGEKVVADEVTYDRLTAWPEAGLDRAAAWQLRDAAQDNNRPGNWAAREAPLDSAATPGRVNSVLSVLLPFPTLRLNEIQVENLFGMADRWGDYDSWIEIHNQGSNTVALGAMSLVDPDSPADRWQFPADAAIPAGGLAVVWLDAEPGESTSAEWHASFRPRSGGGILWLADGQSGSKVVVDALAYPAGCAGHSFGLPRDSSVRERRWLFHPTPGQLNHLSEPPLPIRINEWMADNAGARPDPSDGQFEDWLELHNPSDATIDLSGCYLTDNLNDPTRWQIPAGTWIGPGGFRVVWADGEPEQNHPGGDLHADFKLSAAGEAIGLFDPDGRAIDTVQFGRQSEDVSQGRWPDASPRLVWMEAFTPGQSNRYLATEQPFRIRESRGEPDGALSVTFDALAGHAYRIEATDDLLGARWTTLVAARKAAAATETWILPGSSLPHRFIRILILD